MKKEKKTRGIVREYLALAFNLLILIVMCGLGLIGYLFNVAIKIMQYLRFVYFKLLRATMRLMSPSKSDKMKWDNAMWVINSDDTDDAIRIITLQFEEIKKEA